MLLAGAGRAYRDLICAFGPKCLSGLQSGGVFPFAHKRWVGTSALPWTISLILPNICVPEQADSAAASLLLEPGSFSSLGDVMSLSQSLCRRYERGRSGQNVPPTQMSGA